MKQNPAEPRRALPDISQVITACTRFVGPACKFGAKHYLAHIYVIANIYSIALHSFCHLIRKPFKLFFSVSRVLLHDTTANRALLRFTPSHLISRFFNCLIFFVGGDGYLDITWKYCFAQTKAFFAICKLTPEMGNNDPLKVTQYTCQKILTTW